jgi:hypothetical protein
LEGLLKPEKGIVFFKIRQLKGAKEFESFVKFMFKNAISGFEGF